MGPTIPAKEVRGATQQMGGCRFCGQTYMINTTGTAKDEWLDEEATTQCICSEAKRYKKMKEFKEEINGLLADWEDLREFVQTAAQLVFDGNIASASINTGAKVKINITMNSKGELKVKMTETLTEEIGA